MLFRNAGNYQCLGNEFSKKIKRPAESKVSPDNIEGVSIPKQSQS